MAQTKNSPYVNYERFNRSNVIIDSQSRYYRGCWHLTFPLIVPLGRCYDPTIVNQYKYVVPFQQKVEGAYFLSLPR